LAIPRRRRLLRLIPEGAGRRMLEVEVEIDGRRKLWSMSSTIQLCTVLAGWSVMLWHSRES
jgi:hypothetical protein